MKLCIIGSDKRSMTDVEILKHAKKIFRSVLYVPQSSIILKNRETLYKKINLDSFDAILPRIKKSMGLMAYSIIKNTKSYSPISPESYLFCYDRFLMLEHLSSNNIRTVNICAINSPSLASHVAEKISFPLCIRIPSKERGMIFVNNSKELRPALDMMGTTNEPIYIEEFPGNVYYQAFVIGNSVHALRRRIEKKSDIYTGRGICEKCFLSDDIKKLALDASEAIGAKFCRVDMSERGVINISLAPPMAGLKEIKTDVIEKLVEHIKHMAK